MMRQRMKARNILVVAPQTRGRGIIDILGQATSRKCEAQRKTGSRREFVMQLKASVWVFVGEWDSDCKTLWALKQCSKASI